MQSFSLSPWPLPFFCALSIWPPFINRPNFTSAHYPGIPLSIQDTSRFSWTNPSFPTSNCIFWRPGSPPSFLAAFWSSTAVSLSKETPPGKSPWRAWSDQITTELENFCTINMPSFRVRSLLWLFYTPSFEFEFVTRFTLHEHSRETSVTTPRKFSSRFTHPSLVYDVAEIVFIIPFMWLPFLADLRCTGTTNYFVVLSLSSNVG